MKMKEVQAVTNNGKAYPKFHKKGVKDSFTVDNTKFTVDGKKIRIPKLGWVRMTEELRFDGKLMSATVKKRGTTDNCVVPRRVYPIRRRAVNRAKAKLKLAKIHYRINCVVDDYLHKMTRHVADNYS